jgi:hypothetical protein
VWLRAVRLRCFWRRPKLCCVGHDMFPLVPTVSHSGHQVRSWSEQISRVFFGSVLVVLGVTAGAKLLSVTSHERIMSIHDPVLHLSYRSTLMLAAAVEIGAAVALVKARSKRTKHRIILWLCAVLVTYRSLLHLLSPGSTCPCLGTLTTQLHISESAASLGLQMIIAYLAIGCLVSVLLESLSRAQGCAIELQQVEANQPDDRCCTGCVEPNRNKDEYRNEELGVM